jgi:hypothetical protein
VLTVAYSIHQYPQLVHSRGLPVFLPIFLSGVLGYGFAAVSWTRAATAEEWMALRLGARWGGLTGLAWAVEVFGGNVMTPHALGASIGVLAAIIAAILPFAAGAIGAASTGRIGTGARIGFWTGVVSGLITFMVLAGVGYLVVNVPGFPGVETPHSAAKVLTPNDLAAFNIGDYLAGGVSHLVLIGAPFCTVAGVLGALMGRSFHPVCDVTTLPGDDR